jgi:hypothetical protein
VTQSSSSTSDAVPTATLLPVQAKSIATIALGLCEAMDLFESYTGTYCALALREDALPAEEDDDDNNDDDGAGWWCCCLHWRFLRSASSR